MPGLVPGIHAFLPHAAKTWMAGTKPGHDENQHLGQFSQIRPLDHLAEPDPARPRAMRGEGKFSFSFMLIWVVQSSSQKYSAS
jgi:hypothetical protein